MAIFRDEKVTVSIGGSCGCAAGGGGDRILQALALYMQTHQMAIHLRLIYRSEIHWNSPQDSNQWKLKTLLKNFQLTISHCETTNQPTNRTQQTKINNSNTCIFKDLENPMKKQNILI